MMHSGGDGGAERAHCGHPDASRIHRVPPQDPAQGTLLEICPEETASEKQWKACLARG